MTADAYDVIIIGGGPAGLTAGLYASRARLTTLLLEKSALGGQVIKTERIENYPGFVSSISGFELIHNLEEQAKGFGLTITSAVAESITPSNGRLIKVASSEGEFRTRSLIIATGSEPRLLGAPGEERLTGRGVSYCATCDGAFFREKEVAVVGGGDAAIEEALFLSRLARRVHIIHRRDQLRAVQILQERARAEGKISFVWNTVVEEILGDARVSGLRLKNLKDGTASTLTVDGVFIYVGLRPNTGWLAGLMPLTDDGLIVTNDLMETTLPGVFAAGDVRKKLLRQITTAVGDGATAAFAAEKYVQTI
jgi:thioredoxin reductase (NADPH)